MSLEGLLIIRRCLEAAGIWSWLWWLLRTAGIFLDLDKTSTETAASIAAMLMTPLVWRRFRLALDKALEERVR